MPVDRRDLRRRLFELAAGQGGYFTAAQANTLGYSHQATRRRPTTLGRATGGALIVACSASSNGLQARTTNSPAGLCGHKDERSCHTSRP